MSGDGGSAIVGCRCGEPRARDEGTRKAAEQRSVGSGVKEIGRRGGVGECGCGIW